MNINDPNKFTEKVRSAFNSTLEIVNQSSQQQLEPEHLMQALLEQEGLAASIFKKVGVPLGDLRDRTQAALWVQRHM